MEKGITNLKRGDWVYLKYRQDIGHYNEDIRELTVLVEIDSVDVVSHNGKPDNNESYYMITNKSGNPPVRLPFNDIVKIIEVRS